MENVVLYDDPNRYAEPGKIQLSELTQVFGYQKYFINNFYLEAHSDDKKLIQKKNFLINIFNSKWFKNKGVLDIGANSGFFSFYALLKGASHATALDLDPIYIDIMKSVKNEHLFDNLNVAHKNVLDYFAPADIVIAYALIHWIYSCTSDYGSLDKAIKKLADLTNEVLIVEWIEPNDGAIEFFKHIEFNQDIIQSPYNLEIFEEALEKHFYSYELIGDVSATRKVYLAVKNQNVHSLINQTANKFHLWELFASLNEQKSDYVVLRNFEFFLNQNDICGDRTIEILTNDIGLECIRKYFGQSEISVNDNYFIFNFYGFDSSPAIVKVIINNNSYLSTSYADKLLNSTVKYLNIKCLEENSILMYCIYDTVYHLAAGSNIFHSIISSQKKKNKELTIKQLSRINKLLRILKKNKIAETDFNKLLNIGVFHYTLNPEFVIYSRILDTIDNIVFMSRIYKTDDKKIIKQTNELTGTREYHFLQMFNSKYIVKTKNLIEKDDYVTFELEYINGFILNNIKYFKNKIGLHEFLDFVEACITILELLSEKKVIHRDISIDNIMISNKKPVLIDFGWSIKEGEDFLTPSGLGKDNVPPSGIHSDVYAMGKVLQLLNKYYGLIEIIIEPMLTQYSTFNKENFKLLREKLADIKKESTIGKYSKYLRARWLIFINKIF